MFKLTFYSKFTCSTAKAHSFVVTGTPVYTTVLSVFMIWITNFRPCHSKRGALMIVVEVERVGSVFILCTVGKASCEVIEIFDKTSHLLQVSTLLLSNVWYVVDSDDGHSHHLVR